MKSIEHRTENIRTKNIIINYKNLKLLPDAMNTFNEVLKNTTRQYQIIKPMM